MASNMPHKCTVQYNHSNYGATTNIISGLVDDIILWRNFFTFINGIIYTEHVKHFFDTLANVFRFSIRHFSSYT